MALPSIIGTVPVPAIHDESAYLLAADTFAHGRVTNPTHPLWPHFETFHVIHQPTYSSKFPPGQGVALAVGQVMGHPIIGAWLSVSLACAATTWMLRAWVPPRWAVIGGIVAGMHLVVHWWGQSYWGGGVAFLGGALLGGGAARAMNRPRAWTAAVLALGIAVLANSRPFEGLLTTIPVLLFVTMVVGSRHGIRRLLASVLIPIAGVLLPFAAAMGYYNWRITRSALTMPYAVHQRQYMLAPLMHWQRANPIPPYRHDILRRFHESDELPVYQKQRSLTGFIEAARDKVLSLARWYLRPIPLVIALLAAMFTLRRRLNWLALLVCIWLPIAHMLLSPWMRIQYMAPAMAFFVALVAVGLHRLERLRLGRFPVGAAMVAAVLIAHAHTAVSFAVSYNRRPPPPPGSERAQFVSELLQQPGKHLVIVRYSPSHPPTVEWVYNAADIDASRIVFAREVNPNGDQPLMDYFKDRRIWLLEIDGPHLRLIPL